MSQPSMRLGTSKPSSQTTASDPRSARVSGPQASNSRGTSARPAPPGVSPPPRTVIPAELARRLSDLELEVGETVEIEGYRLTLLAVGNDEVTLSLESTRPNGEISVVLPDTPRKRRPPR